MDLRQFRKDFFLKPNLQVQKDPFIHFELWIEEAILAGEIYPNAFSLTTFGLDGYPNNRMVNILTLPSDSLMVFYTNYKSFKGNEIESNPNVTLHVFWKSTEKQILIKGIAQKATAQQSDEYFYARPRISQASAVVSQQSQPITDYSALEEQRNNILDGSETIPRPDWWGGYNVRPNYFEFWQGMPGRLHQRLVYKFDDEKSIYITHFLQP